MITINKRPEDRVIELGGGDNPNPSCDVNVDVRPGPKTSFVADFNEPLPIQDEEWDGVFSQFVIEHLSWRKVRQFIAETFRILKPGGKAVFVTANTEAQMEWIKNHPEGWDGKAFFDSASCVLFGDQDYPENTHRNFMSSTIAQSLFSQAGFEQIKTTPYGNAMTDMVIEATRPQRQSIHTNVFGTNVSRTEYAHQPIPQETDPVVSETPSVENVQEDPPESLYDKQYFNGGGKVGGYAREGYWDYPVHNVTVQHVLARKPKSVLELGAARGYIGKRIQDAGIPWMGLEISKHCYMTRVADPIYNCNLRRTIWPKQGPDNKFDLCLSIATLEHIPEKDLSYVIKEMVRTCDRGLHGVDFGEKDDGFDKTHCCLRSKSWWENIFHQYAPGWPVEIVNKEELETGQIPQKVLQGDGKLKLNIGSFVTMFHHGWENIDIHDLHGFAQQHGYKYRQCDVKNGLPYGTGVVDLIFCCHMLEHLTYQEGKTFLKECRRVIRPDGAMRFIVPDAELLMRAYGHACCWDTLTNYNDFTSPPSLEDFDEINDGCANSPTAAGKLWSLLHEGHHSCYDEETLVLAMKEAGFLARKVKFRSNDSEPGVVCLHSGLRQILQETLDMLPSLSLYMVAVPNTST